MAKMEEQKEMTTFTQELIDLKNNKTPVFVNGYGIGKIISREHDFIKFEVIEKKEETTGKVKEKYLSKEVMKFPINKIEIISTGEQRMEKTTKEKTLDEDLGGI